ncbi:hypothetical protein [Escherichia coli]|jgi:hypothetical protein|uniref:hypothetical protein n=1 Tax=Escherichia coli TaxID=562 RepID=UPI00200E1056|nr:hypothetical protein [Escherichia coli]
MLVIWGALKASAGPSPPDPGPPWLVLDSTGATFICSNIVLDSSGASYTVVSTVLSSNGTSYNPI